MSVAGATGTGRLAVAAAFAAQGLGYAAVVTALPAMKDRVGIDDTVIAIILLGTCVAAAVGSILADLIAIRADSRQALVAGFAAQAAALVVAALATSLPILAVAVAVYGIGLGTVDAASNMQGSLLQRRSSAPVFGRLYAAYTTAAIVGILVTVGVLGAGVLPTATLFVAAAVQIAVAIVGIRRFDPTRAAHRAHDDATARPPLPRAGIWAVGVIVFAAFVVDSAVASWSTIFMGEGLEAAPALTPLGYGAYLAAVLLARLAADPAVRRFGRVRVAAVALGVGAAGLVVVALVPTVAGAIAGFAAAGFSADALVPVAFSRAGELLPERGDEVIARVNLFNYAGAVIGAVVLGLIATGPALGPAFLVGAVALLAAIPALAVLRRGRVAVAPPVPVVD